MSTITTRSGKGAPLTNNEVDSNFTNLNADKAELSGATFTGEITANGGIALPDSQKATFGASDNLQIYHDTHSYIQDTGAGNLFLLTQGAEISLLGNTSSEYMGRFIQDGSVELYHNGFLKIATTATGIDVTGTAEAHKVEIGDGSAGGTSEILFSDNVSGRGKILYDHSSSPETMLLQTTGTTAISIDNAQNVSIPNGNLDVTGTATMDGLTSQLGADAQGKFSGWSPTGSTSTAHGAIELGSNASYQGIIAYDGSSNTRFLFDNSWSGTGSTFEFRTNTAATAKTHLKVEGTGDISFYEDTGTTAKFFWDASAESLDLTGTGGLDVNTATGSVNIQAGNASADIALGVGSPSTANKVVVTAGGNVGIGTSSPSQALEIAGSVRIDNGASFAAYEVYRDNILYGSVGGGSNQFTLQASNSKSINLFDDSGVGLTVKDGGSVGIGSSTANHFSTAGTTNVLGVKSTNGGLISIAATGTNFSGIDLGTDSIRRCGVYSLNGSNLGFYTNPTNSGTALTEAMRIDSSGNVGIGTSSPSSLLNVSKNQAADTAIEVSNLGSAGAATTASFIVSETAGIPKGWFRRYRDGSARTSIGYDGSFTIESTAGAERMRIDSSGNLLVGHTSAEGDSSGTTLYQNGQTVHKADGAYALELVRSTSDGEIVRFRKDGTAVGSIGTVGGVLTIGNGDTGLLFSGSGDYITPRNPTTQAGRDAAINLGTGSDRFKDLYLSGGVYLGGTGAANLLDDYEKGNWTPIFNNFSATGTTTNAGLYVKVGNLVYVELNLDLSSPSYTGGGSGTYITGLPFSIAGQFVVSVGASNLLNTATFIDNNGGGGNLFFKNSTFTTAGIGSVGFMNSSGRLRFTATYYTTA